MAGNSRVLALLDERGDAECTPEKACGDCPDLMP
jgi:hypothetical protein